MNSYWLWWIEC